MGLKKQGKNKLEFVGGSDADHEGKQYDNRDIETAHVRCRKRAYSADMLEVAGKDLPTEGKLVNGKGEPVKPTAETKTKGFGEPPTKPWKPPTEGYDPDVQKQFDKRKRQ